MLFLDLPEIHKDFPQFVRVLVSPETVQIEYDELETLINRYENIKDRNTYDEFKSYLDSRLTPVVELQDTTFTIDKLTSELHSKYPDLVLYIQSLYNSAESKKITLLILTNQIKLSLMMSLYDEKYLDIFINNYFFVPTKVQTRDYSTGYDFIMYFKPIFVSFLEDIGETIYLSILDKTNNVYIGSKINSIDLKFKQLSWLNYVERVIQENVIVRYFDNRFNISDICFVEVIE